MAEHELKTWPTFFAKVLSGEKRFEMRKRDRPFATGDTLRLREWRPFGIHEGADAGPDDVLGVVWPYEICDITDDMIETRYTGREVIVRVTYMATGAPFLPDDICVMSIEPVAQ